MAPAIFQHAMDTLLQGIPHVICYVDDVLVTGLTEEEHLQNLTQVLQFQNKAEYLGYRINTSGVHTAPSKLQAIQQAPSPTNVTEL